MKTLLVLAAACAAVSAQTGAGRIAVFDDDLPGLETGPVQSAIRVLEGAGLGCQRVHLRDLASRDAFSTERFDTLVLNHSHHLSPAARENLTDFLKAGGDLVMLGASGFLHRQSMTLPAFSRYEPYTLEGTETVDTAGGQEIVPAVEARGKFNGFSAVGFTRRAARFTPLLAAKDRYGRVRGWACGLLTHFAEYPGSNWLLFGIDTPEFYSSDAFARTLRAALGRMKGDELARAAEAEHQKAIGTRIRLTSRAPAGFVHLSPDGKHLVGADGKRLFLTGVNYHRGLDQGEWSQGTFDDTVFEDDFRKAHEAGINFIRLGPAARFYDSPEIVKECARKYGIYLIIILNWGTRRDFAENAERVAQMYAGEPMVIGYDLQNEPAADALAALPYDGKASPVLALQNEKPLASRVEAAALEAALAPPQRAGAGGAPRRAASAGSLPQGDPRELAAFRLLWPKAWDAEMRNSASVFPGLNGPPAEGGYGYLRDAMDQTLGLWIAKHVEAIRKHDKEHLISVGYNNILAALPANRQLQFLTHHVYEHPLSYESVQINLSTMDRLARMWPDKPFTLGEFGYTNGLVMNDGRLLDFHTSAVGEMAHYLYALAKGYDGVTKWVLTDWHWDIIGKAGDRGRATQIYEAYFGMYYYDGHAPGQERAKPIVPAVRFLRQYVDGGGHGGEIHVVRANNPIGTGYVYRAENALFVGDDHYQSPGLRYRAERPANVMLTWKGGELKLMSTTDATLSVDPAVFAQGVSARSATVAGKCGSWKAEDGRLSIAALEGETLTIRAR